MYQVIKKNWDKTKYLILSGIYYNIFTSTYSCLQKWWKN